MPAEKKSMEMDKESLARSLSREAFLLTFSGCTIGLLDPPALNE